MEGDETEVDAWFATHNMRLEVHEVDVTGMERIREGPEPLRYTVTLIGKSGHLHRTNYSAADVVEDAKLQARNRYQQELSEPPPAALGWSQPKLTMTAGDGSWEPFVELRNLTGEGITVKGPMMATGRLLRPDGSAVTSRQPQPWPMPAVLHMHRLRAHGTTWIAVALSLKADEKAALTPGTYRLADVWYGELDAPDVDVEIAARS
jgi:hypothetical protein